MSDKPKTSDKPGTDTARNSESTDFAHSKDGGVTIITESTVQRLDPGPKRPPQRTAGEGAGSGSTKEK